MTSACANVFPDVIEYMRKLRLLLPRLLARGKQIGGHTEHGFADRGVWYLRDMMRARLRLFLVGSLCVLSCGNSGLAIAQGLGVYEGNEPARVHHFESWLGCSVDHVLVFTDETNWHSIAHPEWFVHRFAILPRPAIWSVAMLPKGTSLEVTAAGRYNHDYVAAAKALAEARPDKDGAIYIRIGWELNGDWFPWAAEGHQAAFIQTYRNIVDSFRSVSPKFRFEWNINYGRPMDPATAYPGDRYVDVIGIDFYWRHKDLGNDPVRAFRQVRDGRYGLRYLTAFAKAHGKPLAISEWGVQGDNAAPFIERVHKWIVAHHVLYNNFWDSDGAFQGRLSTNRWPLSGAAFRRNFCPAPNIAGTNISTASPSR